MSSFTAFLEQVQTNAATLDPRRVALTVLALPFFAVGVVVGVVVRTAWTALTLVWGFVWAAGQVGYRTARGPDGRG